MPGYARSQIVVENVVGVYVSSNQRVSHYRSAT